MERIRSSSSGVTDLGCFVPFATFMCHGRLDERITFGQRGYFWGGEDGRD